MVSWDAVCQNQPQRPILLLAHDQIVGKYNGDQTGDNTNNEAEINGWKKP